jgi:hypothetical protein
LAPSTFRKNSCADFGCGENEPAAMLTSGPESAVYPEVAPRDQRTRVLELPLPPEPIERTHARVAFTLREIAWVVAFAELARMATLDTVTGATCTFTRGGTVTLTVWVRLAEDWAATGCATIAIAAARAFRVRWIRTIFGASNDAEQFTLSSLVIFYGHNMRPAL